MHWSKQHGMHHRCTRQFSTLLNSTFTKYTRSKSDSFLMQFSQNKWDAKVISSARFFMKNFFAVSSQALVSWAFLLQEVCLLSAFYYEATRLVYKRCWHPFYHQKEAKKFFQNDFVKNDDDGSLVQNPISIKLRKCILDCLTFYINFCLRFNFNWYLILCGWHTSFVWELLSTFLWLDFCGKNSLSLSLGLM